MGTDSLNLEDFGTKSVTPPNKYCGMGLIYSSTTCLYCSTYRGGCQGVFENFFAENEKFFESTTKPLHHCKIIFYSATFLPKIDTN